MTPPPATTAADSSADTRPRRSAVSRIGQVGESGHAKSPYYATDQFTLYAGDALDVLSALPSKSVQCVVTSPPYWHLRGYETATWIGGNSACSHTPRQSDQRTCRRCHAVLEDQQYRHEPTPQAYIDSLRRVFGQIRRLLVDTGVVWLNVGDSYTAQSVTSSGATVAGDSAAPWKGPIGLPWRVALALQRDGWILRNAVIWHKPNSMPESVHDRLSVRHETIFLLVKQQRYWFDLDAIRVPLTRPEEMSEGNIIGDSNKGKHAGIGGTLRRRERSVYGEHSNPNPFVQRGDKPHGAALHSTGRKDDAANRRGKNPGDVWPISTRPPRDAHFAAFPIDIPLRCIAAGCPPRGLVLDPFCGAATTGLAARQLGRSYIGVDRNPEFHVIGVRRLGQHGGRAA